MKKILFFCFCLAQISIKANTLDVDSVWFKQIEDRAVELFEVDNDSAKIILLHLEKECIEKNYNFGLAGCYWQMGVLLKRIGNYPESLEKFNQSLNLYEKLNNKKYIARAHLWIGSIYVHMGDYATALDYIHRSLDYYENTDENFVLGGAYITTSGIYIYNKEYHLALEYIEKTITEYNKINYKKGICAAMMNKAIIFYEQMKYRECIPAFKEVVIMAEEINSEYNVTNSLVYIGSAYIELKNYTEAEKHLFKVLEYKNVNKQILLECYQYIGDMYRAQKDYSNAVIYIKKAIEGFESLDLRDNLQKSYERLGLYYSEMGNYKQAYTIKQLSYNLRDSIYNVEKSMQMKKLEAIYQVEKKQQMITNLENENKIQKLDIQKTKITFLSIILFLVIVSGGIVLFVRNSRLKVKNENVLLEQKLLLTQLNPHFIFNAISGIQHYIIKNRSLEASSYLSNFAKLMRSILNTSRVDLVSLETEKQTLEDYLSLQKLRLDGNLEYRIVESSEINPEELVIPPMLLQPFIENAIEHGILKKKGQKGKIDINFSEKNNKLLVEITDDGIGRDEANRLGNKNHKSFATEITNSRIKSMKQSYKKGILFNILDLKNKENKPIGTKVIFELPLMYV